MNSESKIPRKKYSFWSFLGSFILLGISLGFLAVMTAGIFVRINYSQPEVEQKSCAVVFGASVWRDDVPSHALFDRTMTGINLYKKEQVSCLILSGGKSKYGSHEADVMKKVAIQKGVKNDDIFIDYNGNNTLETLRNLKKNFAGKSFILVSNDFHLARIKLIAWKIGIKNFSLKPAKYNNGEYLKGPYFFWREVAAVLYYSAFL